MVYGSYQLANPWPGRINTDKTIYLDQFSGKKLMQSDSRSSGAIGQATSFGVYTHMGTEFGLVDRIVMTIGALLLLIGLVVALIYPIWGVSALVVILLDWLVIRRVGRLRSTFGMPTAT